MAGNQNSGRKAVSAKIHLIRGNPSKKNLADLAPSDNVWENLNDIPQCPDVLNEIARQEWERIAGDLHQLRIINQLDQNELAVYCQAFADWHHARQKINTLREEGFIEVTPSGYKQMSVWMQIANRAEERMRVAGAAFGFTPAARQRIQLPAAQGELFGNEQKEKAAKYF